MNRIVKLSKVPTVTTELGTFQSSGFTSLGGSYYDAEPRAILPEDAIIVSEGSSRFRDCPADHKPYVMLARVYRSRDGTSLRARANTAVSGSLASKVPATGKTSAQPLVSAKAEDVLAKAKQFHAEGTADLLTVRNVDVRTGDVVEEDTMRPHRFSGESDPIDPSTLPPI